MMILALLFLLVFPHNEAALNTNILTPQCKPTDSVCKFPKLVVKTQMSMSFYDRSIDKGFRTFVNDYGDMYYKDSCTSSQRNYLSPNEMSGVNAADGTFRYITTINGQFPGPSLVVYEGQTVEVTFVNKYHQQGIGVHFHGQIQRCTNWMDGVPGLTQCAFNPGESFTYRFTADPVGTHWYHSHQGFQRNEGMYGAFVVLPRPNVNHHGYNCKTEFVMAIQEFYPLDNHNMFTSQFQGFEGLRSYLYQGRCPGSEGQCTEEGGSMLDGSATGPYQFYSALVNGKGRRYDEHGNPIDKVPLETYSVRQGNCYKFRLLNTGSVFSFKVSIDQHRLIVTNTEVDVIKPVKVDSIVVNGAERFDFIVEADQPIDNYWIRVETMEETPHFTRAILRYEGASHTDPTSPERVCTAWDKCRVLGCPYLLVPPLSYTTECINLEELQSVNQYTVTKVHKEMMLQFSATPSPFNVDRDTINGILLDLPTVPPAVLGYTKYDNPCTQKACDPACTCTHQVDIPLLSTMQYTFFSKDSSHPVHTHGYFFHVLKIGYPTYDIANKIDKINPDITCLDTHCNKARWTDPSWNGGNIPGLNLVNPVARDTVAIPAGGYVVVRFVADNPGWWFLHCHIDPHLGEGMGLIQQVGDITDMVPAPPTMHLCGDVTAKEMQDRAQPNKNVGKKLRKKLKKKFKTTADLIIEQSASSNSVCKGLAEKKKNFPH